MEQIRKVEAPVVLPMKAAKEHQEAVHLNKTGPKN
jgi:hypothetical protein